MSECNCKSELLEKIITTFKEELESCEREWLIQLKYYSSDREIINHYSSKTRQAKRTVKILERFREEL